MFVFASAEPAVESGSADAAHASGNVLTNILGQFGVDWPHFLAQVIIVLVIYLVLKKYAFGPVTGLLEERRRRIQEGEENLHKIKADLAAAEANAAKLVEEANGRAERLIAEARDGADALKEKKAQEAVAEANQIIAKAKEASELERERLLGELKRDFGRLVVDTTSKVTGKVLGDEDQKKISEETAAQIAL
ncbi:MAG: F0F1 ATP synthase subunit B [Verrucomicrobiales bacterium]